MRIIFYGTEKCSTDFLELLVNKENVVAVTTQPDRPSDRGLNIQPSPVKTFARKKNLLVFTPEKLSDRTFQTSITNLKPDLGIIVSYGKILPKEILNLPAYKTVNVHFSLLPKYRGAAPIQWALINGEEVTGVTVFFIDEGMDTGDIILQKEVTIKPQDDAISLEDKLVQCGLQLLEETLILMKNKKIEPKPQTGEPGYAPMLKKNDGEINWSKKSTEIYNLIRGTKSWPSAWTRYHSGKLLKILQAKPTSFDFAESGISFTPGQIVGIEKKVGFMVGCGEGLLIVEQVQPEGRKPMSAWDFLQGARLKVSDKIGTHPI